jgi:hypothetical protein
MVGARLPLQSTLLAGLLALAHFGLPRMHTDTKRLFIQPFQLLCPTRPHDTLVSYTITTILQESYLDRGRGGSRGFLSPSACTLGTRTSRPGHE